ncbi:MAG TPA: phosphonate C-P lyase system protein PhnH [Thiomonas arsenitoxydans]|jgi:alpha-D-ribose 1-methylphosphonate 5-triphosphate synthase subunit PhnH|uniref:phosphonate C-P lyase system protein PhnH n=1 Tax=Thiomonas TaxID=32012 RepID=UPI0007C25FA7|nr:MULTISPECIES: phosphonate C-P lyase system protein PhnH [Thiomonas]MDD5000060.1 phosphonate C-P lyase system protein PhnH [Thiomonas arsenitoxydans]CQR41539.1 Phosphonate C-P lyase system protein PhnH [Thiomonas sp. CB3]HML82241.1 phosphonate C-P lyase system protein PhnH [Thiomonas arsenitoxydans]
MNLTPSSASTLSALAPGFSNPVQDSQTVFRAVLDAFARPGQIQTVRSDARLPIAQAQPAAVNVLLALLDQDCTLWLSPALRQDAAVANLRFHTGCQIVENAQQAQFIWAASGAELPALSMLACGTEYEPELSATCLVQVDALAHTPGWTLSGPGIRGTQTLQADGLPADFLAQWADNHARFPQGVDLLLCAGDQLVGLPRTTRIGS